jgi:hypothetical protein
LTPGDKRTLLPHIATKPSSWLIQEITMTYEKTSVPPPSSGIARLGRFALFFASAGFAFPNVFVENVDVAELDAKHKIITKKL